MSQTPNADEPLTSETEIIMVISQGPEPKPVTMIPVTNMSLESAIETLSLHGKACDPHLCLYSFRLCVLGNSIHSDLYGDPAKARNLNQSP